jgi:hypothetical protein
LVAVCLTLIGWESQASRLYHKSDVPTLANVAKEALAQRVERGMISDVSDLSALNAVAPVARPSFGRHRAIGRGRPVAAVAVRRVGEAWVVFGPPNYG